MYDLEGAHEHSANHRDEVRVSDVCGCFYCRKIYSSDEIDEWIDEIAGIGSTALCPKCGIDSVIGSAAGFPITAEFLAAMHRRWFSTS